ncbi:MAG: fibronectin type III domain-containing protein [Spirochaetaceae bacterium]|nr:fibronectin type III domain-containing protein [Spirochaetaceae bacterium]
MYEKISWLRHNYVWCNSVPGGHPTQPTGGMTVPAEVSDAFPTCEEAVPRGVVRHSPRAARAWILVVLTCTGLLLGACGGMVGKQSRAVGSEPPPAPDPKAVDPPLAEVAAPGPTAVTVTWNKPDTDLVVTGYVLNWRAHSDSSWSEERTAGTAVLFTITGLEPGTEYVVRVRAVFATGDGAWSAAVRVRTLAATDPQTVAPPSVAPGTPGPTTVTVTWSEPDTDLTISGYKLRWRPSHRTEWIEQRDIASTDTSVDISGLEPGTEYEVQLRATFTTGDGAWSPSIMATTGTDQAATPRAEPSLKIYWVESGGKVIKRAGVDGSNVETLLSSATYAPLNAPEGIALDLTAGKMYWTDNGSNTVSRADLDGGNPETLVTDNVHGPSGIALDVSAGKVYWTEIGTGTIRRANLDGSGRQWVGIRPNDPSGIAVDAVSGKKYWADNSLDRIRVSNLDGTYASTLVSDVASPHGIALDAADGKIYWTETGDGGNVASANLSNPVRTEVFNGTNRNPRGIAVDSDNGKVYWVDFDHDTIERADVGGQNHEVIIDSGLDGPRDIALGQ